jgi:drug/metabolite transporter (DMT)-like permease
MRRRWLTERLPRPPATTKYVLAAVALMTAQPFAVTLTQNSAGSYDYAVLTVSLLSEALKLAVSLALYYRVPSSDKTHRIIAKRDVIQFSVPALLYALNNALLFAIVSSIRPVLFQLLSTTKTVFTAILFRLVLRRVLTLTQQAAVVLLAAGAGVSRLGGCDAAGESGSGYGSGDFVAPLISSEWVGVLLTLVTCFASSLSGVINEALLKKDGYLHSLFLQNSLLYAWGLLINGVAIAVRNHEDIARDGFFAGYSASVVLLICVNAIMGMSISAVLKHCDNLVRVFAHVCAMLLSMLIDAAATELKPTAELVLAVVIVAGSAVVYAREGAPQPLRQAPVLIQAERAEL